GAPRSTPFPYTTLFRSGVDPADGGTSKLAPVRRGRPRTGRGPSGRTFHVSEPRRCQGRPVGRRRSDRRGPGFLAVGAAHGADRRSEEHTSELQSQSNLV